MPQPNKPLTVVISGVNLTEGGLLSVLVDCLASFEDINKTFRARVIVLVNSKSLVKDYLDAFEVYEFPKAKQAWWRRLKFEFYDSYQLSKIFKPDIWIALHDITPNIICHYQVVYCHNPSPFYKLPFKDIFVNYKFTLFNLFYSYLYAINIKRNKYVIVQQDWLRTEFKRRYGVESIVAYPEIKKDISNAKKEPSINDRFTFFYPSFPRVFKNFEVILKATALLAKKRNDFKVILTIDGSENAYSRQLLKKFKDTPNVEFIGLRPRDEVFELYHKADCLLFPSKLETWGLPLSEIKAFNKPILVSNLQYAHEAVGNYFKVKFFDADDHIALSNLMEIFIGHQYVFDKNQAHIPKNPFFNSWNALNKFLLDRK